MALLADSKRKQKLSIDPRGLNWSQDDSKFGKKMLEKFGWSDGKGLGANETGRTEHVKLKFKNDSRGVGFSKKEENNWLPLQDEFSDLLASLNANHGQGATSDAGQVQSLEERSKTSKARLHYHKFTRGKDLSSKNSDDLDCIFGRAKSKSAPVTPQNISRVASAVNSTGNSDVEDSQSAEKPEGEEATEHGVTTIASSLSVQDYFRLKMEQLKASRAANSSAPDLTSMAESNVNEQESLKNEDGNEQEDRKEKKKSKKAKRKERESDESTQESPQESPSPSDLEVKSNKSERKSKKRKQDSEEEDEIANHKTKRVTFTVGEEESNNEETHEESTKSDKKKKKKRKSKEKDLTPQDEITEIAEEMVCDRMEDNTEQPENVGVISEKKKKKKKKSKDAEKYGNNEDSNTQEKIDNETLVDNENNTETITSQEDVPDEDSKSQKKKKKKKSKRNGDRSAENELDQSEENKMAAGRSNDDGPNMVANKRETSEETRIVTGSANIGDASAYTTTSAKQETIEESTTATVGSENTSATSDSQKTNNSLENSNGNKSNRKKNSKLQRTSKKDNWQRTRGNVLKQQKKREFIKQRNYRSNSQKTGNSLNTFPGVSWSTIEGYGGGCSLKNNRPNNKRKR